MTVDSPHGITVDDEELLEKLEKLAQTLGIHVRYEDTAGRSGSGVLRGDKIAVIDSAQGPAQRARALAAILANEYTEHLYLPPAVRELLDRERGRQEPPPYRDGG